MPSSACAEKRPPRKRRKPAPPRRIEAADPHVRKALGYAHDVIAGRVPACKWVRLACERQLRDLERFGPAHPLYRWSEEHAGRVCRFLELLPHIEGPKGGTLLVLEPWQCFYVTTLFGWRRKDTGGRRFRKSYLEVPRGNGKSLLSSGIALYMLAADGEPGAQVYSAGRTSEQARIVFDISREMLRHRPELAEALGLVVEEHRIYQPATSSRYRFLTRATKSAAGAKDGGNPHLVNLDELHSHPDREMWSSQEKALAKRLASLLSTITTAGDNVAGICFEIHTFVERILLGKVSAESFFGLIYTVDAKDLAEPFSPLDTGDLTPWKKANPNWGVSVDPDTFTADMTQARDTPAARGESLRKCLNIWTAVGVRWLDPVQWERAANAPPLESWPATSQAMAGLDLASRIDLAGRGLVFWKDLPREGDPEKVDRHWYVYGRAYLPEDTAQRSPITAVRGWADEGRIITTPGGALDFDRVREDMRGDAARWRIAQWAYDKYQAQDLSNQMQAEGLQMVECPQTTATFHAAMLEVESALASGRLHHDGCPVTTWCALNVMVAKNYRGEMRPIKQSPDDKIDIMVAILMALARAMLAPVEVPSLYETQGIRFA